MTAIAVCTEAGARTPPSGEVGLDQANRAVGQLDAWRAHVQVALMLEEVQVSISLCHRVMHGMRTLIPGNCEVGSGFEVDQHGQQLGAFVESERFWPRWQRARLNRALFDLQDD